MERNGEAAVNRNVTAFDIRTMFDPLDEASHSCRKTIRAHAEAETSVKEDDV